MGAGGASGSSSSAGSSSSSVIGGAGAASAAGAEAGDAGGAIGAAYVVANKVGDIKKRFHMSHAYMGPSFNNQYHENLLNEKMEDIVSQGCAVSHISDDTELYEKTAKAILMKITIYVA